MKGYEVKILKAGYSLRLGPTQQRADGTITLIKGPKKIIVDTGGPSDRQYLLDGLAREGMRPSDISFVICTHGHSDHAGNNNLFADATFIVSHDISKGDLFTFHDFKSGASYIIDENVEVVPTPGHTSQDISVLVKTPEGLVAIVGDLFECERDMEDEGLWRASSELPAEQERSRARILAAADFIIPGHGDGFRGRRA
jgi:glyoxylase-like metal-dependent hydrolase (beta-lactamase superfamily II)